MTTGRINQVTSLAGCPGCPLARRGQEAAGSPDPRGGRMLLDGRGARGARSLRHPRRTGRTETTIQLPPLSPSAPVRTQLFRPGRPCGRCQAAACGPRVKGPDPAGTPTNGGFRGAAPSRNLSFGYGQRPSIHRLQRCRAPRGTRASVAAADATVAQSSSPPPSITLRLSEKP